MGLHFKIDTKATCFLCLNSANQNEHDVGSSTAFKMLSRYLKVDVKAIVGRFISWNLNTSNLSVSLCEDCSSVTNDFLELFQALEGIRLQLDLCMRQLHQFMEKAGKDADRIREYKSRVNTGKLEDLISSLMAGDLRKEMMGKVFRKVKRSMPRLVLEVLPKSKEKLKNIKGTSEEAEDSSMSPLNLMKRLEETEVLMESDVIVLKPMLPVEKLELQTTNVLDDIQSNNIPFTGQIHDQNTNAISSNFVDRDSTPVVVEDCIIPNEYRQYKIEVMNNLECYFCRESFSQQNHLLAHHFRTHVMSILSEKCLLPPGILVSQLAPALEEILRQLDSQISQVGEEEYPSNSESKNYDLNNEENEDLPMPQLTPMEEEISVGNRSISSIPPVLSPQQDSPADKTRREPSLRKSKSWKCIPCRKWFSEEDTFLSHRFQFHKVAVTKDKKHSSKNQFRKGTSKQLSSCTLGHHYKCSSCGKLLPSQLLLKLHYAKNHLGSQMKMSQAQWKCERCKKCFSRKDGLRIHVISFHPLEHFSGRFPPGVTVIEQDFQEAVGVMVGRSRKITTKSGKNPKSRRIRSSCLNCGNTFENGRDLRVHIACAHFDKVIEMLRKRR